MQATLSHHEGDAEFNHCAALLVRCWRLIMVRGVECPLVAHEFRCACGRSGPEVFSAFCSFLCALALTQRRRLLVNPPGTAALTADETRMLSLIAAVQNDCPSLLDAHLDWLAQRPLQQALEKCVRRLGDALATHRLHLPTPA